MSETNIRRYLKHKLESADVGVAQMEIKYAKGMADTYTAYEADSCWIECKRIKAWPKKERTKVRIGLRSTQVKWLLTREADGIKTRVFLATPTPNRWFLMFTHIQYERLMNGMTKEELFEHAEIGWERAVNPLELREQIYGR